MKNERISLSEANYAQVVLCGYPKEGKYGVQLQLKKIDNQGYGRTDKDLYFSLLEFDSLNHSLDVRDSFKNVVLSDSKVVHGQEVFTYKVDLKDALEKAKDMRMK